MNDAEPGDIATEANAAQEMLNSAVFNKAFERMNQQLVDQILTTPPEADAERERLYCMFKAGQVFVQQLAGMINQYDLTQQEEEV
jgi:hypothetical protein